MFPELVAWEEFDAAPGRQRASAIVSRAIRLPIGILASVPVFEVFAFLGMMVLALA